jgi:hypothetical protein
VVVAEMTLLEVTNAAHSADIPALGFTYELVDGPAGATIDSAGVIRWVPGEEQGPGTNVIETVVRDNGVPSKSATNRFTVVVEEINSAPVLPSQADRTINGGDALLVTNTASDSDLPANALGYALSLAPAGAVIDTSGIISWTAPSGPVATTNVFETLVTDTNPWAINQQQLSATNRFAVIVRAVIEPFSITSITATNGVATITWEAVAGQTYRLQYADGFEDTWHDVAPDIIASGASATVSHPQGVGPQRLYRVVIPQAK